TPLVAPANTPFMPFNPNPPDFSAGLRFNLHNNKWGTNFPMWWGADRFAARFVLEL
ncbi:MAG: glycosyl hydrolase, partial [Devosia sp.]|nr:glycosyl hydrolase [Devosia sp.]